ncbi:hypothetical protein HHK36_021976 [Tetracentron sinense]|uniref:Uncharacterized protein n=1 Tax=Tetracentron sinense TaxID=13715 RepID=A0A835D8H0_TETSI|nr:hypothetical protein HHK36_021976 [Tetracentron sinense]
MNGGRRRILGQPVNGRKDRDEDLLLFYEMRKREKERNISLLQPVSDEFEPYAGNFYPLYRIAYAKKGSGHEFLDKNDYDWLKTPPSTPLFPSLEMEANAPELAIQREIPISKTLSRFSGNSEASKEINWGSKPPNPKPRVSSRSVTPSARPSFSSATETRNTRGTLVSNHQPRSDLNKRSTVTTIKTTPNSPKESPSNFLYLNPSKNTGIDSNSKPRSGGVSPLVQSRLLGLSDEILPNLWTDRSSSASRGRPRNPTMTTHPKQESIKPGRKSYSPSKTRDQQIEFKQESEQHSATTKGRIEAGNGTLIFGSRMVEKVMNARKSVSGEERETKSKSKSLGSPNESSGFGRMISKSSFDMAFKHMCHPDKHTLKCSRADSVDQELALLDHPAVTRLL